MSTYDHILILREKEQLASASRKPQRTFRERFCGFWKLKRQRSRVTPVMDGESSIPSASPSPPSGRRSRSGSQGSAGLANFGRTPPPVSEVTPEY